MFLKQGYIQGMPDEIGKLVNMIHLDIFNTNLEGMPTGINKRNSKIEDFCC